MYWKEVLVLLLVLAIIGSIVKLTLLVLLPQLLLQYYWQALILAYCYWYSITVLYLIWYLFTIEALLLLLFISGIIVRSEEVIQFII